MEAANLNFDISLENDTSKDEDKGKKSKIQRRKGVAKKADFKDAVNDGDKDQPESSSLTSAKDVDTPKPAGGLLSCVTVDYWQPYFAIETPELRQRIVNNLNPTKTADFIQAVSQQPDLYGPIWISGALVFMSIVCSSASFVLSRIFLEADRKAYEYNFQTLGFVFSVVYSFLAIFAAAATVWLKFVGVETSLVKVR